MAESCASNNNNLKTWMSQLPSPLKEIPLINLAIPGSHDSMSYGIRPRAKVAPDAEPVVNKLYKVMPCVVRRWAITQRINAVQQLIHGVRYFDLRICMDLKSHDFYFVHGLFCEEIEGPLRQICDYLDANPNEFIIFDCQHFYNFDNGDYDRLQNLLRKIFAHRFYTRSDGPLHELTLSRANALKRQLLVVYRYALVPNDFWPSDSWPTPWPNQIKVHKLKTYLDAMLAQRLPDVGYVSQCVLTPPVGFIVPRFYSSLRNKCAYRVSKGLTDWIKQQRPGPFTDHNKATCNVFIADFVELNEFQFCRVVIELNYKILTDQYQCKLIDAEDSNDDEKDEKFRSERE